MEFLSAALACMCLPIYLPLLANSIRQLLRGEVTLTRWSFLNVRVTRLTGGAAMVYNVAQVFSVLLIFNGLFAAVREGNPLLIFSGLLLGWLIGLAGGFLARTMQGDITETTVGPTIQTQRAVQDGDQVIVTRVTRTPDGEVHTEQRTYRTGDNQAHILPDSEATAFDRRFDDDDIVDADFRDVD
ncbi:MAG: hypothetical protein OHK0046_00820 [Anaerolineae bacterium]